MRLEHQMRAHPDNAPLTQPFRQEARRRQPLRRDVDPDGILFLFEVEHALFMIGRRGSQ